MDQLTATPGLAPDGSRTLTLAGDAGVRNIPALANALYAQMPAGTRRLIVDASGLISLHDDALRILAQAARVLRSRGGRLVLARPRQHVLEAVRATGAYTVLFVQAE